MQPRQSYLICATPRSGSTLVCEALSNTGIAGYPKEYFEILKETGLPRQAQEYFFPVNDPEIAEILGQFPLRRDTAWLAKWDGPAYADYFERVFEAGTTANGVFGAKMMWGYFADFLSLTRQIERYQQMNVYDLVASVFPQVRYASITRQDKEGQAISLWKALQTQAWRKEHAPEGSSPTKKELVFHFGAIAYLEQQIIAHEKAWRDYFTAGNIDALTITYEELVRDYEATLRKTLQYFAIPIPENLIFDRPRMERQADTHSEEWVQRYRQLKQEQGDSSNRSMAPTP